MFVGGATNKYLKMIFIMEKYLLKMALGRQTLAEISSLLSRVLLYVKYKKQSYIILIRIFFFQFCNFLNELRHQRKAFKTLRRDPKVCRRHLNYTSFKLINLSHIGLTFFLTYLLNILFKKLTIGLKKQNP